MEEIGFIEYFTALWVDGFIYDLAFIQLISKRCHITFNELVIAAVFGYLNVH